MAAMTTGPADTDLETVLAVIAHSQIVVAEPSKSSRELPAGFDAIDVAVLEWLAAEGRRSGRPLARMTLLS